MSQKHPQHPMAVVTRRTGLRPDLIRAWERRYRAVLPARTDGNHRLYSDEDIRRLQLIRRALDAGWQIRLIATLGIDELSELVGEIPADDAPSDESGEARGIRHHFERCLAAVERMDGDSLLSELEQASVKLSRPALIDRILVPLLTRIGEGYRDGSLRTAHEHVATAAIRSYLGSLRGAFAVDGAAPRIAVATPAHQHHELGALLAATTARIEGWKTAYLGPNLPAEEIAAAASARGCSVVALGITCPADDPALAEELRRLRRLLPRRTTLIVGGESAGGYRSTLDEIGAVVMTDLGEFRSFLYAARAEGPHQV